MAYSDDFPKAFNPMCIFEGLESFDENTTTEEIVRFMAKVKIEVERFIGEAFPVEDLLHQCRENMEACGAEIDWDHFDDFLSMSKKPKKICFKKRMAL